MRQLTVEDADETGGAWIRFLDRRTNVVSRMYLDEENRTWLSFTEAGPYD